MAITINWGYFLVFLLSAGLLGTFNYPGDKKKSGPVNVGGMTRIGIEIFSAFLGILGAWILFSSIGFFVQVGLTLVTFTLDRARWSWFLGYRKTPPESVLRIQESYH
jgi:hypothetical protein